MVPTHMFVTKGVGKHRERLSSFESALRDASIAPYNLVRVSSIFPPRCKLITKAQGVKKLRPGSIVFSVISEAATDEPNRLIAASIGMAIPRDPDQYGYLSEHHGFGQTEKVAGDYAEDLAAEMLATSLGVLDFDSDRSWDEKRQLWRISGEIVKTRSITQSAVGEKDGCWSTVLVAAVLIMA